MKKSARLLVGLGLATAGLLLPMNTALASTTESPAGSVVARVQQLPACGPARDGEIRIQRDVIWECKPDIEDRTWAWEITNSM
jgi:hypothetical protein